MFEYHLLGAMIAMLTLAIGVFIFSVLTDQTDDVERDMERDSRPAVERPHTGFEPVIELDDCIGITPDGRTVVNYNC